MAHGISRLLIPAAALALAATPAAAQHTDGYNFLQAVKDRDGTVATQMLSTPGNVLVNTKERKSGQTALHIVTQRRDTQWMRFLIQKGANPNIADAEGNTPLDIAAAQGNVDGVEVLLKAGARVDVTNSAGETPLISAVHRRDVELVRLLLANGANPDRTDTSGRSARDYAKLMVGGGPVLQEIAQADADRANKGADKTYGPSL